MNRETLVQRRNRTHAIVEGALLGDIAIVFLLMRVYLPVPVVRTLLRTVASVPFVMLTQRRGIRLAILAALASYILFSALVGPILALSAIDVAVAGLLVGVGRRVGIPHGLNTIWTGIAYAVLDVILPTIASIIIFRYPIKSLIAAARNFVRLLFNLVHWILVRLHAPASLLRQVKGWESWGVSHWQVMWIGLMVLYGVLTMYLVVLISDMVLRQVPDETLEFQKAA